MKKFILSLVAIVALSVGANAQTEGLNIGVHGGIPVGDADDVFSFAAGADVSYLFPVTDQFLAGGRVGYNNYFGKTRKITTLVGTIEVEIDDIGFLPISATGEYLITENLVGAADLGYAVSTKKNIDGGFYYQPKLGYAFSENIKALVGYEGITRDGSTISTINFGAQFALN